jgi:ketosteroid isomerase-like protein
MMNEQKGQEANERFYKAFNSQDLELMKDAWHENDSVVCIHPGWGVLKGFDAILKSWQGIFQSMENLDIQLSNVEVIASEDLVWVSCQENLYTITLDGVQNSKVHATNLFKPSQDGKWRMVLHHASSIPNRNLEGEISSD